MEVDRETGEILADEQTARYSPFRDESIPEETKQAWRVLGGQVGGRKRRYVKGTAVPLESLDDVLAGLGEVIGNLREMDCTAGTAGVLIRAYQVAASCFLEKEEREVLRDEMARLERQLGLAE